MKQTFKILLISLTLLSIFSLTQCGKSTAPETDTNLIGQWQWEYSVGGMTGWDRLTPEINGYNIILSFKPDSTYTRTMINDSVVNAYDGTYYIVYEQIDFLSTVDSGNVIHLSGNAPSLIEIKGNNLALTDLWPDGFGSSYKKIEE